MQPFSTLLVLATSYAYAQKTWTINIGGESSGLEVSNKALTINVGDTVQWNNIGISIKSIHQEGNLGACQPMNEAAFGTSSLFPGSAFSYTFGKAMTALFYIDSPLKDCSSGAEGIINVVIPATSPTAAEGNSNNASASTSASASGSTLTATAKTSKDNNAAVSTTSSANNGNTNIVNGFPAGSPVPNAHLSESKRTRNEMVWTLIAGCAAAVLFA
ncbi:UNVERIFIED_CONTAM: hypothetical protein HDU68_001790 [Siphonaria sp. JEL0065]|nr:hypothetical protein HDU68_001790 [Siphonaria sp. JEL0065]